MTDRSRDASTDWSKAPTTGADFAASFARSFPLSAEASDSLAAWFDLALDAGRRLARAERKDLFVHLTAAGEQCRRLAVAPDAVDAVRERPDATEILCDGAWFPVVEEFDDVAGRLGRR